MKTIGVTGGIGSGKSAVCQILQNKYGATLFNADAVAKKLMVENKILKSKIVATFGAESYFADGQLNRAYVAQKVFTNQAELKKLNALVHPAVRRALRKAKKEALQNDVKYLVYEAALLFESNGQAECDEVWVVHASKEIRIKRVMQRDGITAEQVAQRMAKQLPESEFLRLADVVILNEGNEEELLKAVAKCKKQKENEVRREQ